MNLWWRALRPHISEVHDAGGRSTRHHRFHAAAFALVIATTTLLAGCATLTTVPPVRDSAGVAPSPATEWTPSANAIPPRPTTTAITPAPAGTLSLPQVIDLALSNNPATRTAWLEARAAEAALGSARSAYLPEIDLNATLSRSRGTGSAQTVFGPSLALNYLLFDFGGREAEVAQARQALIAADYLHNQAIQDTILFAEESYYGVLGSRALLAGQDATIKERQAEVDAAEARHRAGVATIADVLQARTALSQAQLTRETFEGSLHAFEGNLATAMGLPANTPVEIGELPAEVPTTTIGQQVDELIARAASTRPDLAASRAGAERARARVQQVRAQGLPSVSLNSSVGHTITAGGSTPYSISVGMRWPIFTGFRNQFDIREAQAEAQRAAEQARGVEQRVGLQVWTSYFGVQTAAARLATARDLLASATQSADVAASRYRAGVGSILDVLTAQAALENARAQEVQSRTDWFLSMAQLAHDTGTLGK